MTVMQRFARVFVSLATLLSIITFASPSNASASEFLNNVIVLTNQHRQAAGCENLTWNQQLSTAAQQHAEDMAWNNYFSHTSRDGRRFGTRIRQTGYRYRLAAENIAAGQWTPEEVVDAWMSSPAHRANILNCQLRNIGIGFATNDASAYGSYWVQDMGNPR